MGPTRSGTLAQNETWGPNEIVVLTDDLFVPAGKTLTINGDMRLGVSTQTLRPRLVVMGHLNVVGTMEKPVLLGSATTARPEDSWEGIIVESGGRVTMTHATIQNSLNGLCIVEQLGQSTPNSITYCTFTRNKQYDLIADGVYNFPDPVGLTISNCIDSVGAGTGFWLTAHMRDAIISNNQFIGSGGSGGSVTGLCFDHPGGTSSPLITANTFSGFSSGQGLKLGGGRAIVRGNTLSNSKYGATITSGTHEFSPASIGGPAVNTFSNNGYAGAYIVGSGASPIFRQNLFSANFHGVVSKSGATPNFGTTGAHGYNSVIGSTNKCLWNQSSSSINAIGNYWGMSCPEEGELPMCIVGATIFPMLCTSPFSARGPLVSVEAIGGDPPVILCRTGPTVHGTAEIEVRHGDVPWEELRVYDVTGRLRDVLSLAGASNYAETAQWNARVARGSSLAAGVYLMSAWREGAMSPAIRVVLLQGGSTR